MNRSEIASVFSLGAGRPKGSRVGLALAIIVLAGTAAVSCGRSEVSRETKAPVEVELEVFSGRPNPRWVLRAEEGDSLLELVGSLKESGGPMPAAGLGYRGFILRDGDREIVVYRRLVRVRRGAEEDIYRDTVGLEKRLVDGAKRRGITVPLE